MRQKEYKAPLTIVEGLLPVEGMLTASKEYSGELGARLLNANNPEFDNSVLADIFMYIGFE